MPSGPSSGRAGGGGGRDATVRDTDRVDVEARILEAAIHRLQTAGYDGLTISAVATLAGVSRPTVYAHFDSREKLVAATVKLAVARVMARIAEQVGQPATAADHLVETIVAVRTEFRAQPTLAPLAFPARGTIIFGGDTLGPEAMSIARAFLEPLVRLEPRLEPEMDEITEVLIRLALSLLMFESEMSRSDDRLRAYLRRRLLPSLGL